VATAALFTSPIELLSSTLPPHSLFISQRLTRSLTMALICEPTTKLNILAQIASSELSSSSDNENDETISFPDVKKVSSSSLSTAIPHEAHELMQEQEQPNPIQYLEHLFTRHGVRLSRRRFSMPKSAIPRPSLEEIEAYSMETAAAVRNGDLAKLKELYYEKGFSLSACNRFGESLLHVCCRRGHAKMIEFMIQEANVSAQEGRDFSVCE
jgi:Ankyrin repeats (many copies)